MGPYGSENFKTPLLLQSHSKALKLFEHSNGPHETIYTFGSFEILEIKILTNFKTLLLLQIAAESFKLLLNFSPVVFTKLRMGFLKLKLNEFFIALLVSSRSGVLWG